tara:strand:- start:166 stop:525 length:360 start_codon:yes stop_codon:yes gene_type:complete
MPYKDPEKQKEWREKNKVKQKEWRQKNKEKIKEKSREYKDNNPFICKRSDWINQGMILRDGEDWLSIYLFYITCENCEECNVKLTDEKNNTSTRRNLDHDHSTRFIRDVVCHSCNMKRG